MEIVKRSLIAGIRSVRVKGIIVEDQEFLDSVNILSAPIVMGTMNTHCPKPCNSGPPRWQCRRHGSDWEYPLEGKWELTPVFLPRVISWTEEPGRLQPINQERVGHD